MSTTTNMILEFFKNKRNIIIIASTVVVGIIIIFAISKIFFDKAKPETFITPTTINTSTTTDSNEIKQEYTNEQFGYALTYPGWWEHEQQYGDLSDIFSDPIANVMIIVRHDEEDSDAGDVASRIYVAEEDLKTASNYYIEAFKRTTHDNMPTYATNGVYDDGNTTWNFQEYGIFSPDGVKYTIRVHVNRNVTQFYDDVISKIITSFKLTSQHSTE